MADMCHIVLRLQDVCKKTLRTKKNINTQSSFGPWANFPSSAKTN
ncbi:hypothetical protein RvY_00974 [Ramazzottius varieornatus]|uniref:Uncharacterized protein n=1 Tax=Ramazzottius varieornatus TaxID=947166 RepID=A0A1D1UEN9_RAMVA|nr:hypothetical protein RvY_00974 [Ramazzottius varieornatus]